MSDRPSRTGFTPGLIKKLPGLRMLLAGTQQKLRGMGLPGANLGLPELEVLANNMASATDDTTMFDADRSARQLMDRLTSLQQAAQVFQEPVSLSANGSVTKPSVPQQALSNAGEIVSMITAAHKATREFVDAVDHELFPPSNEGPAVSR